MPALFDARIHVNPRKRYLELYRTTDPRGNYLGTVRAKPAVGVHGVLDENGVLIHPDLAELRECLPARWRKAFDRAGYPWWNAHDASKPAHMTLRTAKGDLIGTLYLSRV